MIIVYDRFVDEVSSLPFILSYHFPFLYSTINAYSEFRRKSRLMCVLKLIKANTFNLCSNIDRNAFSIFTSVARKHEKCHWNASLHSSHDFSLTQNRRQSDVVGDIHVLVCVYFECEWQQKCFVMCFEWTSSEQFLHTLSIPSVQTENGPKWTTLCRFFDVVHQHISSENVKWVGEKERARRMSSWIAQSQHIFFSTFILHRLREMWNDKRSSIVKKLFYLCKCNWIDR